MVYLDKKFAAFRETQNALPIFRRPASVPCHETDEFSPYQIVLCLRLRIFIYRALTSM